MGRATIFAIGLLLYAVAIPAHAATITVTNRNDSGTGSLRQALAVAHDGDRITFAVSGTITLTSGGLLIFKNVTISGPGANQLSINGNQGSFVFAVGFGKTVTFSGLSVTNAQSGIVNDQSTVSVSHCVISSNSFAGLDNEAGSSAGASMTVANSVISNNSGRGAFNLFPFQFGGASGCACMTITDSVVSNNSADGISNTGNTVLGTASLTVVNSNVSDNAGHGISIDTNEASASATILSTTVSVNSAGGVLTCGCGAFGGFVGLTITNSTISGNSTGDSGGGVYASGLAINVPGIVSIVNSTISGNSAATSGAVSMP
jgi:hypothetical protein